MTVNNNNLYTPDQIKEMRESGQVASKVLKDTPQGIKEAKVSLTRCDEPIGGAATWGSAPRIQTPGSSGEKIKGAKTFIGDDGKEHQVSKVVAPNIDRYNQQAAARALKDIELREAANAAQQQLDPASINNTLQALSRKVARLEKQLKEAKADG